MKRIQIVARIPVDLRREMTRAAKRQRTTLNSLIETALRRHLQPRRVVAGPTEFKREEA